MKHRLLPPVGAAALLAFSILQGDARGELSDELLALTAPLYVGITLHVEPGAPLGTPFALNTQQGFEMRAFHLDALADVLEARGLRLSVACSRNYANACVAHDTGATPHPGSLTDLAQRGHRIEFHRHGGDVAAVTATLTSLAGEAPRVIEGNATHDEIVAAGYEVTGGGGKELATQLVDISTRCYRLNADAPFFEDVSSPLVGWGGGAYEGTNYEPDSLDLMTKALLTSLGDREPGKLEAHTLFLMHPGEFPNNEAQTLADAAKLGSWLDAEVVPRLASGELVYIDKRDIADLYVQWEALGGDNADLFPSGTPPTRPGFAHIDDQNSGLWNDHVADIDADDDGTLWFASGDGADGGIARLLPDGSWDGWQVSDGLASGLNLFLFEGPAGERYAVSGRDLDIAGSSAGLGLNTGGPGWSNTTPNTIYGSSGFLWEGLAEPDGDLYIGSALGLSRRFAGNWLPPLNTSNSPLPHNRVYCIEERAGAKWLGTMGGGVAIFDDNGTPAPFDDSWSVHTESSTGGGLPSGTVRDIEFDAHGGTWFATQFGASYMDAAGVWTSYTPENSGLGYRSVVSVLVDAEGDVWFGTYGDGAYRYQPDTQLWDEYGASSGHVAGRFIVDIEEDPAGDLWFASMHGGGATRFERSLSIPSPPTVGTSLTVELDGAAGVLAFALVSLAETELVVPGIGLVEVDLGASVASATTSTDALGHAQLSWPIPNVPALQGFGPLHVQGLVDGALTHKEQTRIL